MMSPEEYVKRMHPDMEFELREGTRVIADGKITQIIELEDSAKKQAP